MVTDACLAVKGNRRRYLDNRHTPDLIEAIAGVAEDWLDPENPFRRLALERGPAELGFSHATLAAGLDAFFESITRESLRAVVAQDLGHPERLDQVVAGEGEAGTGRLAIARGPELLVHFTASPLPHPALLDLILGLLARSAQFMACEPGVSLLPRLFAHSLREVEAKLAACIEIAEWPDDALPLEHAVLAQADCVMATGSDNALGHLRERLPASVRLLGCHHRLSFGFVAAESLSAHLLPKVAAAAARDVAAWDQLGPLAPHAFYVEAGGRNPPDRFAEALAAAMAGLEETTPCGTPSLATAGAIVARRAFYGVRAASSCETLIWQSPGTTAWTVVYESQPRLSPSCQHRFVHVKSVADLPEALTGADEWRGRIATIGLAASGLKEQTLVTRLAHWGVTRVCPLGRMQQPPAAWRHRGRPALGDLVQWTDWERPLGW